MSFYKGSFHLDVPWDGCMQSDEQHALLAKRQGLVDLLPTLAGPVPLLSVELWRSAVLLACPACGAAAVGTATAWMHQRTVGGSCPRAAPEGAAMVEHIPLVWGVRAWFCGCLFFSKWVLKQNSEKKTTIPYHVASSDTGQQHTAAADKGMPQSHQMGSLLWVTAAVLKGWQSTDPAYSLI